MSDAQSYPHDAEPAHDFADWHLYEGVRTRRILAFFIDYALVFVLVVLAVPVVALVGLATFGIGLLLYLILTPLVALSYIAWTVGGPHQATVGMRLMDVRLVRDDGQVIDSMTAIVHAVLFWAAGVILTPFIVLIGLFTEHKRLLHDLALGTVVVRATRFAAAQ